MRFFDTLLLLHDDVSPHSQESNSTNDSPAIQTTQQTHLPPRALPGNALIRINIPFLKTDEATHHFAESFSHHLGNATN